MSKTIKILQNSVEKTVKKVAKIKTQLANGRQCYWVPEEDYPLGVLNVTEDGEYIASSDPNGPFYGYSEIHVEGVGTTEMGTLGTITITANGTYEADKDSQGPFYGYSTVIVNVSDEDAQPDYISGKDPDGNDEVVKVDDDGNLVTETIPSSIKIIRPPDILTYYDGELIDFHGIYVKGYLADGTEWGVVPNDELSFPEPIAEWDEGEAHEAYTAAEDSEIFNGPFEFSYTDFVAKYNSDSGDAGSYIEGGKIAYCFMHKSQSNVSTIAVASDTPFNYTIYSVWKDGSRHNTSTGAARSYSFRNKTVYYYTLSSIHGRTNVPVNDSTILVDRDNDGKAAWGCIYGSITTIPAGSTQTIPVQWHRPGDGKSLYDSFEITVIKPNDSGGQDPQPAPTPSPD